MGSKIAKIIFTALLLPAAIIALVYMNFESIAEPVRYDEAKAAREKVAIQRLKDIRTLQEAHKNVTGHYAAQMDSLQLFYNTGAMKVVLQIGNHDDSVATVNTNNLVKQLKAKGVKDKDMQAKLYEAYEQSGKTLKIVCAVESLIPVKDTLFNERPDFCIDSLAFIPYSGGDSISLKADVREVSGVKVPLFEARAPFKSLLKGLDEQLVVNTIAEKEDLDLYPGLKVGDIEKPNNNAGNWE
ncbi:MAG: hypothetical protein IKY48_01165 [Bacteroidales bacterium]|nr:hypothetical protein [Bacteroidales bacterium]